MAGIRLKVLPSLLPTQVELDSDGTNVRWRYVGGDWVALVPIADLASSVTVGSVSTLPPGSPATVTNVGTTQNAVLNFALPAGNDGADGADGSDGSGAVDSVNGQSGDVVLAASDVGAIPASDASTFATAAQGALADSAYQPGGGDIALADGGTGASLVDPNADRILFWDDSAGVMTWLQPSANLFISGTVMKALEPWGGAVSDETTAITTGTAKLSFSIPYAFTVVGVYATLNTASSSGTPTFDINEAGSTILSTKIVIDANELTGGSAGYQGTASGAAVMSDTSLAAFAKITVDIDVAGTGAKGAKVFLIGYPT